jgi:toxin-antitoxin system PIN domain toxin
LTVWACLRAATNPRVYERPLSLEEAEGHVESWLARPTARVLDPSDRHWEILRGLTRTGQSTRPLVMDAVLAAIAIEHGATLASTDRDFSRFDGPAWHNPIQRA